ncbi:MAG: hypothetical protein AAF566_07940 [Pseudomonadota bacterium]
MDVTASAGQSLYNRPNSGGAPPPDAASAEANQPSKPEPSATPTGPAAAPPLSPVVDPDALTPSAARGAEPEAYFAAVAPEPDVTEDPRAGTILDALEAEDEPILAASRGDTQALADVQDAQARSEAVEQAAADASARASVEASEETEGSNTDVEDAGSALSEASDGYTPLSSGDRSDGDGNGQAESAATQTSSPTAAGEARALSQAAQTAYAEAVEGLQAQAEGDAADYVV